MYSLIELWEYMLITGAANVEIPLSRIYPALILRYNSKDIVIHKC